MATESSDQRVQTSTIRAHSIATVRAAADLLERNPLLEVATVLDALALREHGEDEQLDAEERQVIRTLVWDVVERSPRAPDAPAAAQP